MGILKKTHQDQLLPAAATAAMASRSCRDAITATSRKLVMRAVAGNNAKHNKAGLRQMLKVMIYTSCTAATSWQ